MAAVSPNDRTEAVLGDPRRGRAGGVQVREAKESQVQRNRASNDEAAAQDRSREAARRVSPVSISLTNTDCGLLVRCMQAYR